MTSTFFGNNNTVLNLMADQSNASGPIFMNMHSYGSVDNMNLLYPVTAMTSNSSGGYTASASGSSAGSPFNVFDRSTSTSWTSLITYNATTGVYTGAVFTTTNEGNLSGEWLQLDAPSAFIVSALTM